MVVRYQNDLIRIYKILLPLFVWPSWIVRWKLRIFSRISNTSILIFHSKAYQTVFSTSEVAFKGIEGAVLRRCRNSFNVRCLGWWYGRLIRPSLINLWVSLRIESKGSFSFLEDCRKMLNYRIIRLKDIFNRKWSTFDPFVGSVSLLRLAVDFWTRLGEDLSSLSLSDESANSDGPLLF